MAEQGRLGKPNSLSVSLPDVSFSSHQQSSSRARHLSPLLDSSPFLSPLPDDPFPSSAPNVNYNIDDDAWADKADPVTGSVFYIEPSIPSHYSLVPSSSSSSLSSSPPMSIAPSSPTIAHYGLASLPSLSDRDRLSSSVQLPLSESPRSSEESFLSHSVSRSSGSFQLEKPRSLRKKLQKMMNVKNFDSGSMIDLKQIQNDSSTGLHMDTSLQIPQGSQIGSHGTPLHPHTTSSPRIGYQTIVELDLCQFQLGSEGVTCSLEKLGIVPARSWKFGSLMSLHFPSFKTHYPPPSPGASQPVVVRGLVPGSPAAATKLKPGDTILSVNHHTVNMDNIDSVLATLSNKIHFLVKKGHSRLANHSSSALLSPPPPPSPHMSSSGGLVRLVTGGRGDATSLGPRKHQGHFHMLLYITLDTKEDDPPEKDILFRFPRLPEDEGGGRGEGVGKTLEQLVRLRGAFLTLSDTLGTITGSPSISNSSVLLDEKLIQVSCTQTGKELLLIALPAELITQYQLQLFLETVDKTLSLMFGSIHDAFTALSSHPNVDHILGLLFDMMLSQFPPSLATPAPLTPCSPLLGIPAIPKLSLPTETNMKLDAMLSELESCDHSNRPEMLHIRRPFLLTGSCLVHRGTLACRHLSSEQQRGVALFCHAYRLLELTSSESVSQIVIWKEVFLSAGEHEGAWQRDQGQQGRRKREFLLAVGLEQTLLCMLMQQVSAPSLPTTDLSPNLDAVYVDRGRALLLELRAQDLLYPEDAESTHLPTLTSADVVVHSVFRRSSRQLISSLSHHASPAPSRSRKLSDPFGINRNSIDAGSDSEEEEGVVKSGALRRRSHSMLHLKPNFRQRKAQRGIRAASLGNSELPNKKPASAPRPPYTLTSGQDNLLLHYIDLEVGRGLMLCPTHSNSPGCIHSELLKSFQLTCSVVRQVLLGGRAEGEDGTESQSESDDWDSEEEEGGKEELKLTARPFVPKASSVMEHGVLWECGTHSLKTVATMRYWVIGRYYEETGRELYICCQENTSQSTVEMAFRFLFGWPG